MNKSNSLTTQNFLNRNNFKLGSRKVFSDSEGNTFITLFGNTIATLTNENKLLISNCGWNTPTTNGVLNCLPNVSIYNHQKQLFLNDSKWNGETIEVKEVEEVEEVHDKNIYFTLVYVNVNGKTVSIKNVTKSFKGLKNFYEFEKAGKRFNWTGDSRGQLTTSSMTVKGFRIRKIGSVVEEVKS